MRKIFSERVKVILFLITGISLIGLGLNISHGHVATTEEIINKLNEESFHISFDLKKKSAVVDGKEEKITELLNISEDKVDELISEDKFNSFISENFIGDTEYKDESIEIKNPYSLKQLIVNAKDKSVFDKYSNINSITDFHDGRYVIEYKDSDSTKEDYYKLLNDEDIDMVLTDTLIELKGTVTGDSNIAWGVTSTGMDNYTAKLNYKTNKPEIKVAVIDSGIYTSHNVFKKSNNESRIDLTHSYNYADNNTNMNDGVGHGTMVSGVIAESTPDNVIIVPMKIFNNTTGNFGDALKAVEAIYQYVDIINLSIGEVTDDPIPESYKASYDVTLKKAYDYGTILIAAAGNDKVATSYPASSQYTIAVSSIDKSNKFSSNFSNYGSEIDFSMPGEQLILPATSGASDYNTGTTGKGVDGTSFSAPFLSAAVALIKSENSSYNREQVINVLKENTDDLGDTGKDIYYGNGTVNFNNHMFNKPVFASIEVDNTNWEDSNKIKVNAIGANKIKSYAITTSETSPATWTDLSTPAVQTSFTVTAIESGINYVWLKDTSGNISHEKVMVNFSDEVKPTINSFTSSDILNTSFILQAVVADNDSGISKIKWFYKKTSETSYHSVTDTYGTSSAGEVGTLTKTHTFSNMDSYTEYSLYCEVYDLANNYTTSSVIKVKTLASLVLNNKTSGKAMVSIGNNSSTNNLTLVNNNKTIAVKSDVPCYLIATYDGGKKYSRITANSTNVSDTYNFTIEINVPIEVYVVFVGDISMNGKVEDADAVLIKKSKYSSSNSNYSELTELTKIIADVDKSGSVTATDSLLIRKSLLTSSNGNYKALNW